MKNYSIEFITNLANGGGRVWTALKSCSDLPTIEDKFRSLRQLVTVIAGPNSDTLADLSDVNNILGNCSPTWRRSINIRQLRAYTFFINLPSRTAYIATKEQGGQKILHSVGVKPGNSDAYAAVILFMHILIRVLEGNKDLHTSWIKDMAVGKVQLEQGDDSILSLLQKLQAYPQKMDLRKDCSSLYTSHPPEITIYARPSSYDIIITEE
jgi:hypothetical protein